MDELLWVVWPGWSTWDNCRLGTRQMPRIWVNLAWNEICPLGPCEDLAGSLDDYTRFCYSYYISLLQTKFFVRFCMILLDCMNSALDYSKLHDHVTHIQSGISDDVLQYCRQKFTTKVWTNTHCLPFLAGAPSLFVCPHLTGDVTFGQTEARLGILHCICFSGKHAPFFLFINSKPILLRLANLFIWSTSLTLGITISPWECNYQLRIALMKVNILAEARKWQHTCHILS